MIERLNAAFEELRAAVFEMYAALVKDGRREGTEQQRRATALQELNEFLDFGAMESFSARHLELLVLLVAYWREAEQEGEVLASCACSASFRAATSGVRRLRRRASDRRGGSDAGRPALNEFVATLCASALSPSIAASNSSRTASSCSARHAPPVTEPKAWRKPSPAMAPSSTAELVFPKAIRR